MDKYQGNEDTLLNIAKIMIPKVCTVFIHEDDTVRQGIEVMERHGYTAIPVLDPGERYIGCLSDSDILRHVLEAGTTDLKEHEKYRIKDILRRDFCPPLGIQADIDEVTDALLRQNFVPIVDDRNYLCGIVTRRSLIMYYSDTRGYAVPE